VVEQSRTPRGRPRGRAGRAGRSIARGQEPSATRESLPRDSRALRPRKRRPRGSRGPGRSPVTRRSSRPRRGGAAPLTVKRSSSIREPVGSSARKGRAAQGQLRAGGRAARRVLALDPGTRRRPHHGEVHAHTGNGEKALENRRRHHQSPAQDRKQEILTAAFMVPRVGLRADASQSRLRGGVCRAVKAAPRGNIAPTIALSRLYAKLGRSEDARSRSSRFASWQPAMLHRGHPRHRIPRERRQPFRRGNAAQRAPAAARARSRPPFSSAARCFPREGTTTP